MAGNRKLLASAILAGASAFAAPPALAAECGPLHLVNSFALTLDGGNRPLVPVTIGGKPRFLLFDTGGTVSTIKKSVVDEFHLASRRSDIQLRNIYGDRLDRSVTIPTLTVGRLRGNAWKFAVEPAGFDYSDSSSVAGTLAPDIFRQFDVDLDFAARKLNLFSPDHCQGKVLYWKPKALGIVPMQLMRSGHIYVRVTLDGERVDALLDTGASTTIMNSATARRLFHLDTNGQQAQSHRFKSLAFEGVQVPNPTIEFQPDLMKKGMPFNPGSTLTPEESQGLPDLIVGQSTLSRLHVYIAYRERKLYITEASPPSPAAQTPQ